MDGSTTMGPSKLQFAALNHTQVEEVGEELRQTQGTTVSDIHNLDYSPRPVKFNLKLKTSVASGTGIFAKKKNSTRGNAGQ